MTLSFYKNIYVFISLERGQSWRKCVTEIERDEQKEGDEDRLSY